MDGWLTQQQHLSLSSALQLVLASLVAYGLYRLLELLIFAPYRNFSILRSQGLPGPAFLPLTGEALHFQRYARGEPPLDCFHLGHDLHVRYGPVVHLMFGCFNLLHLADPELVQAVWRTQLRHYHKGVLLQRAVQEFIGRAALSHMDEPQHGRFIRIIAPAFQPQQLQSMLSVMVDESEQAMAQALSQRDPSSGLATLDVHALFTQLALSIMLRLSFGSSLHDRPEASAVIHRAITESLPLVATRVFSLVAFIPVLRSLPLCGRRQLDRLRAELLSVVGQMVADRRAGRSRSSCAGSDLLDILLQAVDADTGERFSDEQVTTDAALFVLAGYETTSSLMAWVVKDLAQRPQLWLQCRNEVERVTDGGPVLAQHLPSLQLIECCIQESFRLHPPVPVVGLQAKEDHWLGDGLSRPRLFIPAGTMVWADNYSMHRSEELWGKTAAQYDEQRWMKGSSAYRELQHTAAFNGFSLGSRSCLGKAFAWMEAKVMLATMVRRCSLELVEGQSEAVIHRLTAMPKHGLYARLRSCSSDDKEQAQPAQ